MALQVPPSPTAPAIGPRRQGGVPTAVKAAIVASAALIPLAYICIHRLATLNDFFPLLSHLKSHGPHYLPGSTDTVYTRETSDPAHPLHPKTGDAIVKVFTGIEGLDGLLRVLVSFFSPVFRDEELTALCISLTGTFGVAVALLCVEGERRWRGWKRVFAL